MPSPIPGSGGLGSPDGIPWSGFVTIDSEEPSVSGGPFLVELGMTACVSTVSGSDSEAAEATAVISSRVSSPSGL